MTRQWSPVDSSLPRSLPSYAKPFVCLIQQPQAVSGHSHHAQQRKLALCFLISQMTRSVWGQPQLSVDMAAGLLGQHNSITSNEIIEGGVLAAMLALICSAKHKSQLAGLQVLASLALVSNTAAQKLMSQRLLAALQVRSLNSSSE